jgi:hypothetical protein
MLTANHRMNKNWLCFVFLFGPGLVAAGADFDLRVVYDDDRKPIAVEVVAAVAQSASAETAPLVVRVVNTDSTAGGQAVAGKIHTDRGFLRFTPQFAFRPGMSYEAVYSPAGGGKPRALAFSVPEPPPAAPTRVVAIYPSSDVLPDNHLRFYLHFSAPMSFGEAYTHVKLLEADGKEVKRAFLEIGEELWDGTGTRLTLLFDPGRVKKGLSPREQFGPVLMEGKGYRLVIDKAWRDANNKPLAGSFEKGFRAGPAVESAVDAKKWHITAPKASSQDALVIRFDRPLDRALLQRMISVRGPGNKPLAGEIAVFDNEQRWEFRPDAPWQVGQHALVVDTALEDCAGNNLARPFEVDVFDRVDKTSAPELMRIGFETKK